jgi:hypothetical protein
VSRTTLEDALAVLRALVKDQWPGERPVKFSLTLSSGETISLPFPTVMVPESSDWELLVDRLELMWFGQIHDVTTNQLKPLELLLAAYEDGKRDVLSTALIGASETSASNPSVREIFKRSTLCSSGVLVPSHSGRKGSWRLQRPEEITD